MGEREESTESRGRAGKQQWEEGAREGGKGPPVDKNQL